jgi:hypothetical protein
MSDPNWRPEGFIDTLPFSKQRCPPCVNDWRCNQGRCAASAGSASRVIEVDPATDSELDRWLEAAERNDTKRDRLAANMQRGAAIVVVLCLLAAMATIAVRGLA